MATQRTTIRVWQSAAGTALLGVGLYVLYRDMAAAAAYFHHVLVPGGSALGTLPALILAISPILRSDAASHQGVLPSLMQHICVTSLPLMLLIAGTVLWRDTGEQATSRIDKKDCARVDLTADRSMCK